MQIPRVGVHVKMEWCGKNGVVVVWVGAKVVYVHGVVCVWYKLVCLKTKGW